MPANGPEHLAELVRAHGVRDRRLLEAIASVPRAEFVPPAQEARAYRDQPIPIPHDQVTTQPSLSAAMIEALALEGEERVLEVGTGYGFQTALLARLAGQVFSIERFADLAQTAQANLARQRIRNVEVVVGDGTAGLPERAPFDAIVVSAAFTSVPEPLAAQLRDGGRLVQPMGPGGRDQVTLFERRGEGLERRAKVIPAHFVKLYGEHGFHVPG
ncbi:MAG: protein-L-isoaspartate(D-aspartate) O-methyltransferase [Solirubrobacterales bacterium]|nr:protein-L-isoaspartate(D-aspartate) O-methyltransferase [Solirubrobacterales bacterium]